MSHFERGHVIGGRYELTSLLGRGSMGEVWRAHHLSLGEDVAIKLLSLASSTSEVEDPVTASARFRFEAQIAARLSRETRHIVRVTDHGEEAHSLAYLVMELLEGRTLEKRLMLFGEMEPAEVSRLVAQIARALECAHAERIVHRDLKPANVFLARDEERGLLVKLLDFGIARATRTQRTAAPFSTGRGMVFGTPGYMSPEQMYGEAIDARADLWALATVAYEALTGELPLSGLHAQELRRHMLARRLVPIHEREPRLPSGLAGFFERAFALRVEDRFASATELASSFEQAISGRDATRDRTAPMPRLAVPRGDTLPMAVASAPRSTPSRRRAAWPWLVLASAVALPPLVAAQTLRTPRVGGAAPASSTAPGLTDNAASTFAAPAEVPSAAKPASSTDGVMPYAGWPSILDAGRPARPAPGRARPVVAGASAVPGPSSSRSVAPSGAPVFTPPREPARGVTIDKSATL